MAPGFNESQPVLGLFVRIESTYIWLLFDRIYVFHMAHGVSEWLATRGCLGPKWKPQILACSTGAIGRG